MFIEGKLLKKHLHTYVLLIENSMTISRDPGENF